MNRPLVLIFAFLIIALLFGQVQFGRATSPATTYCYEPFENLSTIHDTYYTTNHTLGANVLFNRFLSSNSKEEVYSLGTGNATFDPTIRYMWDERLSSEYGAMFPDATTNITLGMWIYFETQTSSVAFGYSYIVDLTNGYNFGLEWAYTDSTHMMLSTVIDSGSGGNIQNLASGNWYWVEICLKRSTSYLYERINGTDVGGGSWHTFSTAKNWIQFQRTAGSVPIMKMDFLRIADNFEFPPSSPIHLNLTSTPYNADFAIGSTSYAYPQILTYASGSNLTITSELARQNPLHRTNETTLNYYFSSWTLNGIQQYSTNRILELNNLTADQTLIAVYLPEARLLEPNINIGIGLLGLILMFLSWFVGYWKVQDEEYGEAFMYWLMLFGIGFGLFTVLLGG